MGPVPCTFTLVYFFFKALFPGGVALGGYPELVLPVSGEVSQKKDPLNTLIQVDIPEMSPGLLFAFLG